MARQATSETGARERSHIGNIRVSRCAPRISAQVFAPLLRVIFCFSLDTLEEKEKQTVTARLRG